MAHPLAASERAWLMLRHVPPRQLARRLVLRLRQRFGGMLPDVTTGPPPSLRPVLPPPLLPPRQGLEPLDGGWRFIQPWGSRTLSHPPDWAPPFADAETASWRTTLHYMEYLEGVDDAAFMALVDDWIAKNPLAAADAWRFTWRQYNLSIRVVVWLQQLARRRAHLPEPFVARTAAALARQLRFLERHLETDIHGNHLVRNLKALLWAAAAFGGPEARRWQRRGERLLADALTRQILADGCHYERSPSYHCQVLGDLLEVASVLGPGPLRERLATVLDRMALACRQLTHPDGKVALFNDGGLDMAYPPAPLLAAHAAMGRPAPAVRSGPFVLADAGFYGLRSADSYLVVDCGPIGPDALTGHGHGDILSFEWSLDGRRVIVDQGTYQYPAGPRRVQSRGTASHNTASIDGAEMCDFFGAHRCGRRARPVVLEHRPIAGPAGDGFLLEGSHDGFTHLPGRPRHVRRFTALPRELVIDDRLAGTGQHRAEAGLLLHPDCRVSVDADGATVTTGPLVLRIEADQPLRAEPAEWFPNLYTALPTTRLRYAFGAATGGVRLRLRA
jgi:uncharacterized heparinase superfamily protein